MLAQHHNLSMDVAFDRLRRYCRYHNLRLAEVARQLTTRELNPETIPAPARPAPDTESSPDRR